MLNIIEQLDRESFRSYTNLLKATRDKDMTLVCGAGLSLSAGLPSWFTFIKKIVSVFFLHWQMEEQSNKKYKLTVPKEMSIAMAENIFLEDFSYEGINELVKEDSLIVAQLIKNCIEQRNWTWLLRKSLYDDYREINFDSAILKEIANLIAANLDIFKSTMTYNYDDLLEHALANKEVKVKSVISENHMKRVNGHPIYHLHGLLPILGGAPSNKIYLSEEDYLTDIIEPNSWYNQIHGSKLTNSCCLFVGLSFNDPSLKRKLAIHKIARNHYHYAFLTHKDTDYERKRFLLLRNELLRLNVRVIKYPYSEDHSELKQLISSLSIHLRDSRNRMHGQNKGFREYTSET